MHINDCYQKLELPPTATAPEIKRAYKRLVKHWHPDRFEPDSPLKVYAEERLKLINAAYDYLRKHHPDITSRYQEPSIPPMHRQAQTAAKHGNRLWDMESFRQGMCFVWSTIYKSWNHIFDTAFSSKTHLRPTTRNQAHAHINPKKFKHILKNSPKDLSQKQNSGNKVSEKFGALYRLRFSYGPRRKGSLGPLSGVPSMDKSQAVQRVHRVSPIRRVD